VGVGMSSVAAAVIVILRRWLRKRKLRTKAKAATFGVAARGCWGVSGFRETRNAGGPLVDTSSRR
jgi:hypothetical protein